MEDMQKLGKQLDVARNTFDDAMKKFSEGRGNILRRTEDLKVLGAKTPKQLPVELSSPPGTGDEAEVIVYQAAHRRIRMRHDPDPYPHHSRSGFAPECAARQRGR